MSSAKMQQFPFSSPLPKPKILNPKPSGIFIPSSGTSTLGLQDGGSSNSVEVSRGGSACGFRV